MNQGSSPMEPQSREESQSGFDDNWLPTTSKTQCSSEYDIKNICDWPLNKKKPHLIPQHLIHLSIHQRDRWLHQSALLHFMTPPSCMKNVSIPRILVIQNSVCLTNIWDDEATHMHTPIGITQFSTWMLCELLVSWKNAGHNPQ